MTNTIIILSLIIAIGCLLKYKQKLARKDFIKDVRSRNTVRFDIKEFKDSSMFATFQQLNNR